MYFIYHTYSCVAFYLHLLWLFGFPNIYTNEWQRINLAVDDDDDEIVKNDAVIPRAFIKLVSKAL